MVYNSSVITESFHGYQAASLTFSDKSFSVKAGRREIWTSKSFEVSCDVNSRKAKCMLLIDDLTVLNTECENGHYIFYLFGNS